MIGVAVVIGGTEQHKKRRLIKSVFPIFTQVRSGVGITPEQRVAAYTL